MGIKPFVTGAKGGSSQHTPVEAKDTLRSISYFQIEDALSEGEIGGLVNGLQSVKLDGTPVANANGTLNFSGVSVQIRTGTQSQSSIPGYGSVSNEIAIQTELKSDNAWIRAVDNLQLSAVAITLQVDALQKSNTSNGDINGYLVNYAIDVSTDGGDYQTILTNAFNGKASNPYQRTHRIDLPKAALGWNVRVRRLTPNANSATVADTTRIISMTEIIDAKLRYPNTAYVAISGDASQFSNIPVRSYVCWGRLIRIPSNYDPTTRAYNGVWDGTFKIAWTDNPAWILYDMIVNERFGLGAMIDASLVDKWELYRIAQYCDQLVPDGKGGMEPRYRCTVYIQTQQDAFRVLANMASVFNGVSYWMGNTITTVADMPADPVYTYTAANVIEGKFTYQSSARKTRYSAAMVTYSDPTNTFKPVPEYVPIDEAIARYGLQQTSFVAFGCAWQGQAHRRGKWAVLTSLYETDSVSFAVGLEGLRAAPGQYIRVQDPKRAGLRQAGRLSDGTVNQVTVDREPGEVAVGDTLTIHLPEGVAQTRTIAAIDGRVLTVSQPFTEAPVPQSVWVVESSTLKAQLFRVLNVRDESTAGKIQFTISAVQHNPDKYEAIDNGALIQVPPISKLPTGTQPPATNVQISGHVVIEQGIANNVMTIAWDKAEGASTYKVEWQKDNGQWIQAGTVSTTSCDVIGVYTGTYIARVTAIRDRTTASLAALSDPTAIVGKTGAPPALAGLACDSLIFGIRIRWTFPAEGASDTQRTEIWASTSPVRPDAEDPNPAPYHMGDYSYPTSSTELHGLLAGTSMYFWGRLVDKAGNIGPWYPQQGAVNGQSSSDATPILQFLTDKIERTQLAQDLRDTIDSVAELQSFIEPPSAWVSGTAYQKDDLVSHDGRMYRAQVDVPAGGAVPGTDGLVWQDIGSVEQTATGLALQMAETTLKVEELDGEVQATATKTESVYVQLNPTRVGADTDGKIGDDTSTETAGFFSQTLAQVDDNHALGKRLTTVQAQFDTQLAAVTTDVKTLSDGQQSIASQVTTVQSVAGNASNTAAAASASAQLALNTAANVNGKVSSSIVAKVGVTSDGKYFGAGWAIGIDGSGGTVQSQFLVTVDTFAILPSTAGGNAVAPLVVQGGQVFLNQALIGTGWINNAMIGNVIASTAVNNAGQPVWEINKNGTRYVRGNQFTITEDVNGWRMSNGSFNVIEIGVLS
ncbi:phage tail protein [Luteibacter sp. PPL552]